MLSNWNKKHDSNLMHYRSLIVRAPLNKLAEQGGQDVIGERQ